MMLPLDEAEMLRSRSPASPGDGDGTSMIGSGSKALFRIAQFKK
jgi:hypothetical protein